MIKSFNLLMSASRTALVVGALISSGVALAQSPAPLSKEEGAGEESRIVHEDSGDIVVTARRRSESLQSVPVSINAFDGAALESRSIRTTTDLTQASPGLRFSSEGSTYTSSVSMRGLGKNAAATTGTPAVVVYFAEVPVPGDNLNIPTYDLASVQVLKGPQGTLFGRNTIGGAILIAPERPSFDVGGYMRASYGNYDYKALEGAINLPLIDDVAALRVAGQIRRRDGYVRDLSYGDRLDDVHQNSVRASLLLKPTNNLSNTTIFDYFEASENGNGYILFRVNHLPGLEFFDRPLDDALAAQRARGIRRTRSTVPDPYTRPRFWGITNTTEWQLGGIELKNIFGYRVNDIRTRGNFDGLPSLFDDDVAFYKTLAARNNDRSISDEFQAQGKALGGRLDFIVGAFYSKFEPNGVRGITTRSFDLIGPSTLVAPSTYATIESTALFGQLGYDLGGGFKLNAGLRYSWTKTSVCGITRVAPPTPDAFYTEADCRAFAEAGTVSLLSKKEHKPTWTIGIDYQATPDLFLYAASRRGYREGGINTPLFNSPNTTGDPDGAGPIRGADLRPYQYYAPEKLTDVEFGVKSRFALGRAQGTFNVSAFHTWYDGAVQSISIAGLVDPDSGFPDRGSFGYNSGKLRLSGVEVDTSLQPLPRLTIVASGSYLKQKISAVNTVPPFPTPTITLPSPKWSASIAADYALPLGDNYDVVLHGDYAHLGDYEVQGSSVPGYDLFNARLDWRGVLGSPINAGFFMKNVFDKDYIAGPHLFLQQFPPNAAIYGEPRTYGLELTFRF